jgi:hypothetical protein
MGTVFSVGAWGRDSAALLVALGPAYDSVRTVDARLATSRNASDIAGRPRATGSVPRETSLPLLQAVLAEARLRLAFRDITRGYALDRAALALEGVADSAVLNMGGQVLVVQRATGTVRRVWPIGIPNPDRPLDLLAVPEVPSGRFSVSTSSQADTPAR